MKHYKSLRLSLLASILLISSIYATETVMKKAFESTEIKCGDPCQECQRAVYQLKFQGATDCNGACRDACFKVREAWGTAFNPFEPFLRDMFGKCEICFRNGHCAISQCKDQERNELDIINRVVNAAHFTAKISPELLVALPYNDDPQALNTIAGINKKVNKVIKKDLNNAVVMGSSKVVVPKVQNLISKYANSNAIPAKVSLNGVLFDNSRKASSASVTFFDEKNKKTASLFDDSKKAFGKLQKNTNEIKQLKKQAGKANKINAAQIAKKEKKTLKRLAKKVDKLNKKSAKSEKALTKLANNPKINDPNTKNAIKKSLSELKELKSNLEFMKIFK